MTGDGIIAVCTATMNATISTGDSDRCDRDDHPLGMLWLLLSPVDNGSRR